MVNAIVMKHFVGTLVRYSNGGQFQPYLAEKFKSSNNGLSWKFELRPGLKCDDGEAITSQGYIEGLLKVLRMYAAQGPLPIISDITGWSSFLKEGSLKGLRAVSDREIEFSFDKTAGPGFLEYLSMPYYGYFCRSNFNKDKWIDKRNIVSSSSYKLDKPITDTKSVVMAKRSDWPLNPETAPTTVFFSTAIQSDSWEKKNTVIQTNLGWNAAKPTEYREIPGPPDMIRSVILDPTGPSGFFSDVQNRRIFRERILSLREKSPFPSNTATLARSFYAGSVPTIKAVESTNKSPKEKLKVFLPKTSNDDTNYAIDLLKRTLEDLRWEYELYISGQTPGVVSSDSQSKTKFDIRLSSVIAGSVVEPWVVEMMFGSNQGVSYPDPSGQVTQYAKELMAKSEFSFHEAGVRISQMVADDAAVIPIYHSHTTWYFSNDLDVSRISGDLIIPSFEDIGSKE